MKRRGFLGMLIATPLAGVGVPWRHLFPVRWKSKLWGVGHTPAPIRIPMRKMCARIVITKEVMEASRHRGS